ncbi:MAG: tetratricopeptide repeat protein [Bauldia sp.]|nr:tetratricopeptide repeat protein [Bauldia sp.]
MNWKDLLVGAAVTLLVTVVAGIVVYYFTREPSGPSGSKLEYTIQTDANFETERANITFLSLRLRNTGDRVARNVGIVIEFPSGASIQDRSSSYADTPIAEFEDNTDQNKYNVVLNTLAPKEVFLSSLLVAGLDNGEPKVSIRSDETVAELISNNEILNDADILSRDVFKYGIIVIVFFALIAQMALIVLIRYVRYKRGYPTVPMNTVFLYLQLGMYDQARGLYRKLIDEEGADSYKLSGYATSLALTGAIEESKEFFTAAEWWIRGDKHAKAVVKYNRATAELGTGHDDKALQYLKEAAALSSKEVRKYCVLNRPLGALVRKNPNIVFSTRGERNI